MPPPCSSCGGARYVRRQALAFTAVSPTSHLETQIAPCPTCRPQPTRDEILRASGLIASQTFEAWRSEPALEEAARACHDILAGDRWCAFLRGPCGCGKTHLANATGIAWTDAGQGAALFTSWPEFLDDLRATQARRDDDDEGGRLEVLLARCGDAPLLIIDDLGAERPTPWAQEQLYKIVERRSRRRRPLIVTSNVRKNDERDVIGERVLSRLAPGEISVRPSEGARDMRREFE